LQPSSDHARGIPHRPDATRADQSAERRKIELLMRATAERAGGYATLWNKHF
jgi:hypothetical protein